MEAKILECSNRVHIARCASAVRNGAVIVFPTDTVYGIGCNPYNDSSVERIFQIKGRNQSKPLPVMGTNISDIERLVHLSPLAKNLARSFWPGALTIISPCIDDKISKRATAGGDKLAVRIPRSTCTQTLLNQCKYLVGTSANISGREPCASPFQVLSSGLSGFDLILDGGILVNIKESTIVEVIDSRIRIIRNGAIKSEEILKVASSVQDVGTKVRNES